MLTKLGWFTAIIIAVLFWMSGLEYYLVYPIAYLLLGSLVSKLNPHNDDNKGRNTSQVLANAGVAAILAFAYLIEEKQLYIVAIIISFSVALSDTFSSEIGKRYGRQTYDICSFNKSPKGLSGGVSGVGTLAGFIGSILISSMYYLHTYDIHTTLLISVLGFAGMLIDSVIGCAFQAKYMMDGQIKETGSRKYIVKGYYWIDNNMTNFMSIAITVMIYLSIFYFL